MNKVDKEKEVLQKMMLDNITLQLQNAVLQEECTAKSLQLQYQENSSAYLREKMSLEEVLTNLLSRICCKSLEQNDIQIKLNEMLKKSTKLLEEMKDLCAESHEIRKHCLEMLRSHFN